MKKKLLLLSLLLLLPFCVKANEQSTLYDVVKGLNTGKNYSNMGNNYAGVVKFQERGEDVYIYVGNIDDWDADRTVTPNFVVINNLCFRVLRTTYTGGTKVIYYGEYKNGTCSMTDESKIYGTYNTGKDTYYDVSNAETGYMFGDPDGTTYEETHANVHDSELKEIIDNWYKDNLLDYSEWFEDAIYCNNRQLSDDEYGGSGSGHESSTYASSNFTNPTLACELNDSFTVNNADGNKALTYPVATLSADELVLTMSKNTSYSWIEPGAFTLSPISYDPASGGTISMILSDDFSGWFDSTSSSYEAMVLPVVSLNGNILVVSGSGQINDPYILGRKVETTNGDEETTSIIMKEEVKGEEEVKENPKTGDSIYFWILPIIAFGVYFIYVKFVNKDTYFKSN